MKSGSPSARACFILWCFQRHWIVGKLVLNVRLKACFSRHSCDRRPDSRCQAQKSLTMQWISETSTGQGRQIPPSQAVHEAGWERQGPGAISRWGGGSGKSWGRKGWCGQSSQSLHPERVGKGRLSDPWQEPAKTNSSGYRIKRDRGRKTWKIRDTWGSLERSKPDRWAGKLLSSGGRMLTNIYAWHKCSRSLHSV